eukprot:9237984-Pyramimonas_sp.AAC.1
MCPPSGGGPGRNVRRSRCALLLLPPGPPSRSPTRRSLCPVWAPSFSLSTMFALQLWAMLRGMRVLWGGPHTFRPLWTLLGE